MPKTSQKPRPKKKPPSRQGVEVVEAELVEDGPGTALALRETLVAYEPERAKPFGDLYAVFLADKSEATARNYRIDLEHFAVFMGLPGEPSAAIQMLCGPNSSGADANRTIYNYRAELKKRYSPSTINRRLAALRSVTKLARMFGVINWELEVPGEKLRSFRDTAGCGVEGLEVLVETIEREIAENEDDEEVYRLWRDRALLRLMYNAGLRRMEPLTARYPEDLRINPSSREGELSIIGKKRNGEREWALIGTTAWDAIQDWLRYRGTEPGPLFPGQSPSRPLHVSTINIRIHRLSVAAGVRVTPHALRHTAITEVLNVLNGDTRAAQRFARHASPATTMLYDDNRQQAASRAVAALDGRQTNKKAKKRK